ncbi:MAG: beta-ketoacyl-[acyl-carrier-protein] synthase family protein [Planctomycetota bacterium]
MSSTERRVVITGMSVISPLGNTKDELWEALSAGRSGVGPLTVIPSGTFPVAVAAEIPEFQGKIDDFGPLEIEQKKAIRKGLKVMCRECQMAVAAAQGALHDAGVSPGSLDPSRTGIDFGSDYMLTLPEEFTEGILQCLGNGGQFDFSRWALEGMPKMSPLWLLKYLPNMPASHIAIYNDMRGPNNSLTLREASSNAAVTEAFQTISRGRADSMLAGATGTRLHPMKIVHVMQQEEVAPGNGDPSRASRPFDRNRTGMVLGEGAGAVILEDLASAEARGATIYAEVLGGAARSVSDRSLVAYRGQAMRNALAAALQNTGLVADDVGHLNAHGLSTRTGDIEEAWAIDQVFGGRSRPLPVTAPKSYFGNLGAGGGLVELVASVMSLRHKRLFPILNYEDPDPECPIAGVSNGGAEPGNLFVNLNVAPQGQASALVVRSFEG